MMKIYEKNVHLRQEESCAVLGDCIVPSADLLKERNGKLCIQFENVLIIIFLPLSPVEERLSAHRRKIFLT